jgi:hypothetical protein
MNPKEKAIDLVKTMLAQMPTISPIIRTSDMRKSAKKVGYLTEKAAKNCALTAAEEIIRSNTDGNGVIDSTTYNYWQSVIEEIEKL